MRLSTLACISQLSISLVSGTVAVSALNLYVHHNCIYANSMEKIDGIFSFTRITKEKYTEIDRISPLGNTTYIDYNNDGLVDKIHKYPCYVYRDNAEILAEKVYSRQTDYYAHQIIFLQADKEFQYQLARFQ